MEMSRSDFNNALRAAVSSEFSTIPTDENSIHYIFSERFNRKMEKLIRSQKKIYYRLINTASKRVAVICLVVVMLFATACSVKAIREPIINFIKQVYEAFTHYTFEGETADKITKEYFITEIPEGFEQTYKTQHGGMIVTGFTNASGDIIEFVQMTTKYSIGYFVDNEYSEIATVEIDGLEVEFKKFYDVQSAIWTKDGYVFSLDCFGNVESSAIIEIIKSIR